MKTKRKARRSDIITTLPQAIIETILCLLRIEEAARTSILSREWRYKWTTIPKLVFVESTVLKRSRKVSDFEIPWGNKDSRSKLLCAIHQVLLLRQGPIHEFSLSMNAPHTCFQIDQIILHLSRSHPVKKLTFHFYGPNYGLPLSFFSLHHLTDLDLDYCDFNSKPLFNGFGSLTTLTMTDVCISRETLLHILSNCPSLKSFSLLMEARDFHGHEKPSIMELFKCLPVIEHLTFWGYIIPTLVQASVPEELPTSLIHLKYVCIRDICFIDGYGSSFLAVLTKCCPNLEKIKLVINVEWDDGIDYVGLEACAAKLEKYSNVWLKHMNELVIEFFTNHELELEFVKFILAKSPNLKKVKLLTLMANKSEELEIVNSLLSLPRASPLLRIISKAFR